jgi:hypothetical protein
MHARVSDDANIATGRARILTPNNGTLARSIGRATFSGKKMELAGRAPSIFAFQLFSLQIT